MSNEENIAIPVSGDNNISYNDLKCYINSILEHNQCIFNKYIIIKEDCKILKQKIDLLTKENCSLKYNNSQLVLHSKKMIDLLDTN